MLYYISLFLWLKSELTETASPCSCMLASAGPCALQPPQEVPLVKGKLVSRVPAAVPHITLSRPLLQLAAAGHGCHFWKVSSCFSLNDRSTLFWDN